ncbi:DUF1573 domain-containing protein [Candidatus Sumerlaeota bacterium]|nr:DUF1573 domain-containing protein [Candidatus Sumerlaeota bacterium]
MDFGDVFPESSAGLPVVFDMEVLNDTAVPIRFLHVDPECGCTSATIPPREIPPGDVANLILEFDVRGRTGMQSHGVAYELRGQGDTESRFAALEIQFNVVRDLILSRPSVTVRCDPSTPLTGQTLSSDLLSVVLSDAIMNAGPARVDITPVRGPPEGVTLQELPTREEVPGALFAVMVSGDHLSSPELSARVALEIVIRGADDAVLAQGPATLHVQIVPSVEIVTDPADRFLGILQSSHLPHESAIRVRSEPPLDFRVSPGFTSGEAADVAWSLSPSDPNAPSCPVWLLRISVRRVSGTGAHTVRIPLEISGDDANGHWSSRKELDVSWIALD